MRTREIVIAAVVVAACLSGACDRPLNDGVTSPSAISTSRASTPLAGSIAAIPVSPAPPNPPGPTSPDRCDHTKARLVIGQPASAHVLERARDAAGARTARFLRPNDIITLEFLASRLNLVLDAKNVVRSMYCG